MVLSATTARTAPGRRFLSRYQRVQDWADRDDATLAPFFEVTEASSSFTGEEHTAVVFPTRTLVEYADDEVVHVAPSVVDGEVRTVEDRLGGLEARTGRGPESGMRATDEDSTTTDIDRARDQRS